MVSRYRKVMVAIIGMLIMAVPALAQDNRATYDEVTRIAARMYCPICENEPLDECRNATCIEWKNEIARQLAAGRTDEEIVNYFVERYGQHVVGVPRDPALRFLAFFAPIIGVVLALVIAGLTFSRWRDHSPPKVKVHQERPASASIDDDYRARLEQDLLGKP